MFISTYRLTFVAPAFLGNADQDGQWRTPPIKALLPKNPWLRLLVYALPFVLLSQVMFGVGLHFNLRDLLSVRSIAIPGALPPMVGWAAAANDLHIGAWILFAILFFWQHPHFYAIAWMYREDYGRAGIRMLPVVEPDGRSTARQALAFALVLIPASLLPGFLFMAGHWYLAAALLLGGLMLRAALRLHRDRTALNARGVLKASVLYLPLLYMALLLDSRPGLF